VVRETTLFFSFGNSARFGICQEDVVAIVDGDTARALERCDVKVRVVVFSTQGPLSFVVSIIFFSSVGLLR